MVNYNGLNIDERFIKYGRLTLLAVYNIDSKSELLEKTNIVVLEIRNLLFKNPNERVIKAEEISKLTQISEYEVCIIFGFLDDLDYVGVRVRAEKVGFSQVEIGGSYFEQYLEYEGIETLIEKAYEKSSRNKSTSQNYQTESSTTEIVSGESQIMTNEIDSRKVFVVHGRNLEIRDAMFRFLRSIDLDPIEWATARRLTGHPSPYVGEILDAGFSVAQAVLVLFTPDDIAKLINPSSDDESYETELTPQARQNVIFEAGMAMAMFPKRTVLVEIGKLRPISDISGRHVLRLNNSTQRRQELIERLEDAGCIVNYKGKTTWHTEGNFELAPIPKAEDRHISIQEKTTKINVFDLDETKIKILIILARSGGFNYTQILEQDLRLERTILDYHLNGLVNLKLINKHRVGYKPGGYKLSDTGNAFVVENNLLKTKANSQVEKLPDDCVKILSLLNEQPEESDGLFSSQIAQHIETPEPKTIYLLQLLEEREFVGEIGDIDYGRNQYYIKKNGRKYLYESD